MHEKKHSILLLIICVSALLFYGCGSDTPSNDSSAVSSNGDGIIESTDSGYEKYYKSDGFHIEDYARDLGYEVSFRAGGGDAAGSGVFYFMRDGMEYYVLAEKAAVAAGFPYPADGTSSGGEEGFKYYTYEAANFYDSAENAVLVFKDGTLAENEYEFDRQLAALKWLKETPPEFYTDAEESFVLKTDVRCLYDKVTFDTDGFPRVSVANIIEHPFISDLFTPT